MDTVPLPLCAQDSVEFDSLFSTVTVNVSLTKMKSQKDGIQEIMTLFVMQVLNYRGCVMEIHSGGKSEFWGTPSGLRRGERVVSGPIAGKCFINRKGALCSHLRDQSSSISFFS